MLLQWRASDALSQRCLTLWCWLLAANGARHCARTAPAHISPHQEIAMSNSRHTGPHGLKPRAIKRLRQSEAALRPQREPLRFPDPEPPLWKPLG